MSGVLVLVGTLVLATLAGLAFRARNGQMRTRSGGSPAPAATETGIDLQELGLEAGSRATLLQFSSTFCAPCRATRTLLSDIAEAIPGVRHHEVDVADGDTTLELVRRLDIRRTPTTLVLDADSREVRRASGVPRREQVVAAVAEIG